VHWLETCLSSQAAVTSSFFAGPLPAIVGGCEHGTATELGVIGLALFLACQAQNPKQRIYNAGSGVVTSPDTLAQIVRELAPQTEVKVTGASGTASDKSAPLDLSTSKAELGYTPRFPLKEALRNYMEELWEEQRS